MIRFYPAGVDPAATAGFVQCFPNISAEELKALKHLAKELLGYSDTALTEAIRYGALIEVKNDG